MQTNWYDEREADEDRRELVELYIVQSKQRETASAAQILGSLLL